MENPVAPVVTFESFGLRAEVISALKGLGYEEPTPIQRETIPALIAGRDVLGQAATGTGKTAAFALPMLERVDPKDRRPFEAQALVLVPTRELAMQVAEAVQKYGAGIGVTALAVYGGQEIFNQVRPLKRGVDVVVATPGRALDHIGRKTLQLSKVKFVVLDEADEMLDMGFEDDLKAILNELPPTRQTALFSATLPSRIAKIAEKHLKDPIRVSIAARSLEAGTLPNIRQAAYVVQRKHKEAALMRVLEWESPQSALIFCRTRNEVEELSHVLMRSGYAPAALHGGLTQEQRDGVLKRFKEGAVRVLVATDVAARGLHVEALSHVVNFDLPTSPEVYVHRIGRTGRAGKDGIALSFLDSREMRLLGNVERQIKKKVPLLTVPTRAQLDAKRSETVAAKVKAAMETPEVIESFTALVNKAAEGASMETVAAAAMYLLQQQLYPAHDSDSVEFPRGGAAVKSERSSERPPRGDRPQRSERSEWPSSNRSRITALSFSLGSHAGVRPQDLVGAIANEANLPSRQIEGIRVDEFTSRVEVPNEVVERVIQAMHATKIRGRKVRVTLEGQGESKPSEFSPKASTPRAKREEPETRASSPRPRVSAPRVPRASTPRAIRGEEPQSRASTPRPRVSAPRVPRASAPRAKREELVPRVSAPPADKPRFGANAERRPRVDAASAHRQSSKPRFGDSAAQRPRFGAKSGDKPRFESKTTNGGSRFGDARPSTDSRFGASKRFESKPASDRPRFGDKPERNSRVGNDRPSRFASGSRPARGGRMEPKKR